MVDHVHCWHDVKQEGHSDTWDEICCQCGMIRTATQVTAPVSGHGPFLPQYQTEMGTKYSDPRPQ